MSADLPARIEPPSERSLANDLPSARPDQLIAIDRKGEVQSAARYRWRVRFWYGSIIGMVAFLNAYVWLIGGPVGLLASGPFALWAGHVLWRTRQLKHASLLIQDMRLEEARQEAGACARNRWLPAAYRGLAETTLCTIARYEGQDALALEHLRRARKLLRKKMVQRRILDFGEVAILVNLGELSEARRCLEHRREGADGEVYRLVRITAELYLALAEGRHAFEEPQLHEWGRYALGLTVGAPLLGLTGWAFERLGDADMAAHLFSESADRWHPRFDNLLPRLHAVMRPHLARVQARAE